MPVIPETKEIKGRKTIRNVLIFGGLFFGLAAYGFVQKGDAGAFLFSGAFCAGLLFAASKVKTHKKLQAYGGTYR